MCHAWRAIENERLACEQAADPRLSELLERRASLHLRRGQGENESIVLAHRHFIVM